MNIRFISSDRSSYRGPDISFSKVGEVKEVSDDEGARLIETFPDWFEDAGSGKKASGDSEDSEVLAPDSSESGANLSQLQLDILSIIRDQGPMKIGTIGSEMKVTWQSIRSDIDVLVEKNIVLKDYDNKYSVIA